MAAALRGGYSLRAPLLAATLALGAALLGLRGLDLPAQLYRIDLFHREGLTLWDSQWYGGHWTLSYSVIFPPVAGVLGVIATEGLCASVASWMFDRLVVGHFGRAGRVGSLLFAAGTLAQVAIGQLPYLLGEALALSAFVAALRGRRATALLAALAAALASPLAGAFLALAAVARLIVCAPRERILSCAIAATAAAPVLALAAAFPGQGAMPFPVSDFAWLLGLVLVATVLVPASEKGLRAAGGLYLAAIFMSFALPTAVGGNVSRLGECLGGPLLACVLWPRHRALAAAAAAPLALLQWGPVVNSLSGNGADPSTQPAYFRPAIDFLHRHDRPLGRLELVPTRRHWEAAYVAPHLPLARGWERQLDTTNNPLFYGAAPLTATTYRAWLIDNGVRYVALPDTALDYAALAEARLIRRGVGGLRSVWHDAHWRIFEVAGASGIVSGPVRLQSMDGSHALLRVTKAGTSLLRLRYSALWSVTSGRGCLSLGPGGWTTLSAPGPEQVTLGFRLSGDSAATCPASMTAGRSPASAGA